jgi:hypothetical protein
MKIMWHRISAGIWKVKFGSEKLKNLTNILRLLELPATQRKLIFTVFIGLEVLTITYSHFNPVKT